MDLKLSLLLSLLLIPVLAQCQQKTGPPPPPGFKALLNQDYVGNGNPRQMLDLYLPDRKSPEDKTLRPLVVYIHGGGWSAGSKDDAGALFALIRDTPYVGASIGYRLTNEAIWPAQIHDCKAAIRWLRGHAQEYGIDPEKIAAFGISAGGHLVSMLGVTGGDKELEGNLGKHVEQSSRVNCVLDFCGPSDFLTFGGKGSVIDPEDPNGVLARLLGGPLKEKQEIGRKASPINYLTSDDAPFLLIHGNKDNIVPYSQALEFDAALDKARLPATLLTGDGAGHVFFSLPLVMQMRAFISRHLSGQTVEIPEGMVPGQ